MGLCLNICCCWPGRQGSAKNISQQKGPQPKKFGNQCHREGPITEKDLDMAMIVLVRGTKSFHLSRECRGRRNDVDVGSRMASRKYLGATPIWALRTISST